MFFVTPGALCARSLARPAGSTHTRRLPPSASAPSNDSARGVGRCTPVPRRELLPPLPVWAAPPARVVRETGHDAARQTAASRAAHGIPARLKGVCDGLIRPTFRSAEQDVRAQDDPRRSLARGDDLTQGFTLVGSQTYHSFVGHAAKLTMQNFLVKPVVHVRHIMTRNHHKDTLIIAACWL